MSPVAPASDPMAPRRLFAHHLKRLMEAKGWSQSELARRAFMDDDKHGGRRDLISKYLNLRSYPDERNMQLLAAAFGVSVEEMIPAKDRLSAKAAEASLSIVKIDEEPGFYLMSFTRKVSRDVRNKILALLDAEDEAAIFNGSTETPSKPRKARR